MESAIKILTMILMNKLSSSEAGSKIMGLNNSAKQANALWEKFQPKQ